MSTAASTYVAVVFAWSWSFWALHVVVGGSDAARSPIFLIGGAGPLLVALALTQLRESAAVRRDYWVRVVDPRRIRGLWWLAVLLMHPAIVALAIATEGIVFGALVPPRVEWSAASLASTLFFVFWFGPLPEEMGWRGFALDRLLARRSALTASLVLGSVWALWHVPLFFVPGTFQNGLGFGSTRCWIFLATMLPLSVLMTWTYRGTDRSTLGAALVHWSGNLCGLFVPKSERLAALELFWLCVAAAWVSHGRRSLR